MPQFRKKPVVVEAVQFDGYHPAVMETKEWPVRYAVHGRQGRVFLELGDFIIAELDGSGFYPCKPDIFAATYEAVS